ncbi:MAG: DUF115 domain-containing protein [Clostridium sp.]|nr:DUF115 domain-containing protein [Clostridium sp.]
MTLYEKNMQELKNKYPIIYNAVKDACAEELSDLVHIEDARKGGQIVVYHDNGNDVYLNSKYDPENEALKYMEETFEMQNEAVLMMCGLSNGYYIREHMKHTKGNTKCIVFEPSLDIFIQVVLHIDISDLIKSERICIVVKNINMELFSIAADNWIDMGNKDFNKIIVAPKYVELFNEDYEKFKQNCIDKYINLYSVANAVVDFGTNEVINVLHNMKYLIGCRCGTELKGRFPENLPAIVVSAGPSLEKNVALLKDAKGKAFIFVVDAAVSKVMELGIKPDAIISIDPRKPVEQFKCKGIGELPFFVHTNSNTQVLKYVNSNHLFFFSSDSIIWNDLFDKMGTEIETLSLGGSVATAAIACLISWGIKRIILIGQDLAFTGNRMHVGEEEMQINHDGNAYTHVKDIYGNETTTSWIFYNYLRWIEEAALKHKDIHFIDATEGGAYKNHCEQMTFKAAIERYCTQEYNISDILLSLPRLFEGSHYQLIIDALEKMKVDFRNMRRQSINCKADCLKGKKIIESRTGNFKELKQINRNIVNTINTIKNSDEYDCIYKWTAKSELDMLKYNNVKSDSEETAIQKCERNARYFNELANAMTELIKIVDECIVQLKQ